MAVQDIAGKVEDCGECITRVGPLACSGMGEDWPCLGKGVQTRKWAVGKNQIGITLPDIFQTMPTGNAIAIRNLLFRREAAGVQPSACHPITFSHGIGINLADIPRPLPVQTVCAIMASVNHLTKRTFCIIQKVIAGSKWHQTYGIALSDQLN